MQLLGQILIISLVVAITMAIVAYPAARRARRRREMQGLAEELGWPFEPERDASHEMHYPLEVFSRRVASASFNTICGTIPVRGVDIPVKMGDFVFWAKSGVKGGHKRSKRVQLHAGRPPACRCTRHFHPTREFGGPTCKCNWHR